MENIYLPSRQENTQTLNTAEFPPIGLDFGTSNSVLGHYTDEFHRRGAFAYSLPLLNGRSIYPSVVYFNRKTNQYTTGIAARNKQIIEPDAVAASVKRYISGKEVEIAGNKVSPVDLAAHIISGLLRDVRATELSMQPSVVTMTVPYYFKQSQNYLLRQAAQASFKEVFGKDYQIEVIPEPVAAAIDYISSKTEKNLSETVLIYDIGGGTSDVTIVRYTLTGKSLEFEVLGIDGDGNLGGDDIDKMLVEYICVENNIDAESLCSEKKYSKSLSALMDAVREIKEGLSVQDACNLVVPSLFINDSYINIDTVVTRKEFNHIIRNRKRPGRKNSIAEALDEAIKRLKVKTRNATVDMLIPIGGTSLIPEIQNVVKANYPSSGHYVMQDNGPQISVARGAAIYSALKDERGLSPLGRYVQKIVLKMRVPHTLSVAMHDGTLVRLINSNSPAPCCATKTFFATRTVQDKQFIELTEIELYQGDGSNIKSDGVELVGRINLNKYHLHTHGRDLKDIPIQITFKADTSNLEATIVAAGVNPDHTDLVINETIKL